MIVAPKNCFKYLNHKNIWFFKSKISKEIIVEVVGKIATLITERESWIFRKKHQNPLNYILREMKGKSRKITSKTIYDRKRIYYGLQCK